MLLPGFESNYKCNFLNCCSKSFNFNNSYYGNNLNCKYNNNNKDMNYSYNTETIPTTTSTLATGWYNLNYCNQAIIAAATTKLQL